MNHFLTFGAGQKFIEAKERLVIQAQKTGIFQKIESYIDNDLKQIEEFWSKHGDFVLKNTRMYGYGIWKPFLVLKELEKMNTGDRLFYADSGCEFDFDCENPKEAYEELVSHMDKHKIIGTLCNWDKHMNKMDLVLYLEMQNHPGFMTEQIQATTFLIEKTDETYALIKEWYETCENYHMINDEPSFSKNRSDYDEHRHDQSIFSLLLKKRGFYDNVPKEITLENVICLSRNRSGIHFPACRVTGSIFYSLHFGDEFINGLQIIQMSKLIRQHNPQYILETGFGSGRTMATMIQSCRKKPILKYVNCDKNYRLYDPVSTAYKAHNTVMCPYIKWYEKRSVDLFREKKIEDDFPEGIEWATIDGDPTYEGCLCELFSVLPHMKSGGIIYIVVDRNKGKNRNIADATDFFCKYNESKLTVHIEDVVGQEIKYVVVQ